MKSINNEKRLRMILTNGYHRWTSVNEPNNKRKPEKKYTFQPFTAIILSIIDSKIQDLALIFNDVTFMIPSWRSCEAILWCVVGCLVATGCEVGWFPEPDWEHVFQGQYPYPRRSSQPKIIITFYQLFHFNRNQTKINQSRFTQLLWKIHIGYTLDLHSLSL